tara:strand:- start:3406 stop:4242 length:837 start_codon:yes stop_codon:yes gene_type:complete
LLRNKGSTSKVGLKTSNQENDDWSLRFPTKLIKEQTLLLPVRLSPGYAASTPPVIAIPLDQLSDPGVARLVNDEYLGDGFEAFERDHLLRYLRSGDCLIDIGAHFGLYSIFASASIKGLQCVALEPHPVNFKILETSIRYSHLHGSIKGLQCALGEYDGVGKLRINSSMGHHLAKDDVAGSDVMDTPVHTLDNLIERFDLGRSAARIWLKIDTEGREKLVLSGARNLLRSGHVQGILWESSVGPLENPENKEIQLFLKGFGYSTQKITPYSMFSILVE